MVRALIPLYSLLALLNLCTPGYAQNRAEHFVIPVGQESRIEALIAPFVSDGPLGTGQIKGISVQDDEIRFALEGRADERATLLLAHPSTRRSGDQELPSFTVRVLPVAGFTLAQAEIELLLETLSGNDGGDFPWRRVEVDNAPPPDRAGFGVEVDEIGGTGGFFSWLKGTGFAMILWLCLIALALWAIRRNGRAFVASLSSRDLYFWATLIVVLVGALLRFSFAPEALYKEAHPFRGLEAAFIPISQPVALSSSLPGYPALLQFLHGVTGAHPVELLFFVNLLFGCALPALAAGVGARLHRVPVAPLLYATAAAFLPHAMKYSHSEVFTGPMAFLILLSIRSWLDVSTSRGFAVAACLSSSLLAWMRPEAVLVLPGLVVFGLAGARLDQEGFAKLFKRCRRRLLLVGVGTAILVLPVLPLVWSMQASGQGIVSEDLRTLGQTIDSVDVESFDGMGPVDLLLKIFRPGHNVFLNSEFTPPLWMASAALGFILLLRRRFVWALALVLSTLPLMIMYGLLVSSLLYLGEMRYQLSLMPFFVILVGAGATWISAIVEKHGEGRLGGRVQFLVPGLMLLAFILSFLPYRDLVARAEHPVQQEFEVLRGQILNAESGWETGAFVAFPTRSDKILRDLRPADMSPILVNRAHEMQAIEWKDIPKYMERGAPVFLYRGLYAHYVALKHKSRRAWFRKIWLEHFEEQGFKLEPVFEEDRPFLPHHAILDRKLGIHRFKVGLYRVSKAKR